MITKVSNNISIPLIIGGGINTTEKALSACESGADIIVVGNAIEKDAALLDSISETIHLYKK
jgi:putative glycerol-1-phosphate prenyltransferase